ncbi:hypothetical protein ABZZ79_18280 [Streptomyces sp. NPDC006458]|uniref:hypothetical protein n=1 Tax=Streptomyces sp. NPDC006458 TaxID=3154302 RepID=UPI0033A9AEC0
MEEQTYDPVLNSEDVPRWRLVNPLRPPAPGRALVLVRDSGPSLTVRSGEEIPSSRFGAYHTMVTVDMTEHRLLLDIPVLSRDATFSFRSRVDLVCSVADPAEVVSRGIRDMSGALYGHLRRTLRSVARDYDISEFHEAEIALNSALAGFRGDDAVRLRDIQIELLVDEDEVTASGREFRDVVRETRLDRMRRGRHVEMIREEGVDGLLAEIMEREGPRAALAWFEKGEAEKREVRREVMRMVLERGDADREPFEQAELERAVLEEVLRDGDELFETATRRGRLRGTATRALESGTDERESGPEREPLRGEVVRERHGDAHERDAERGPGGGYARDTAPPARPRRTVARAAASAGPPDDEPLPEGFEGRTGDAHRPGSRRPADREPVAGRRSDAAGTDGRPGGGRTRWDADGLGGSGREGRSDREPGRLLGSGLGDRGPGGSPRSPRGERRSGGTTEGGPGDGTTGSTTAAGELGGRERGDRGSRSAEGNRPGEREPDGTTGGRHDGPGEGTAVRVSRVRGTAKRPRGDGSGAGAQGGERR